VAFFLASALASVAAQSREPARPTGAEGGFSLPLADWRWAPGDGAERAEPGFDDAAWAPIALPAALKPGKIGATFWLRAKVQIPPGAPDRMWLLIGKGSPAIELFVDGAYSGSRGALPPEYSLGATRATTILLPGTLKPGSTAEIALRCSYMGSAAELKAIEIVGAREAALEKGPGIFWNGTLYQILAALCLFIGAYSILQFFSHVQELADLYYGAAMLFLSLYLHDLGSDRLLVEATWFRGLARAGLVLSMSFLAPFFTSFFGFLDSRPLRLFSFGTGLAFAAAFLALSGDTSAVELVFTLSLVPVLAGIAFCGYMNVRALRAGVREAWPILAAVVVGIVLAGYDSFYKATGREPFAWLQGIAFFALNAAIFAAISMRQTRLKVELAAYARESEAKKTELAGYLDRIVAAGSATAAIASELDQAAASAQAAAFSSAQASRGIDERTEIQARSAAETDALVAGFAESTAKVDAKLSEQAVGVERTAAAATELSAGAESVALNIERAASFTDGLATLTGTGQGAAKALEAAMGKIQEGSAGIGEIVEAMNQFAERTNLLAMNAAIEAAHSGQSGRGFAIIANEVKKLAQAQSERAERIKAEVAGIAARVSEGARDTAAVKAALADISEGALGAAERLAEVREGTKEQAKASGEIRDAMGELAAAAAAIRAESLKQAALAERASAAVASVSVEASGLRSAAGSIARESGSLVQATGRLVDLAARCRELTASLAASNKA
jgi:methyl-accepting chemotaxis protein